MKILLKKEALLAITLVAPFIYLAFVWQDIPARVPTHFNASFQIDGWMPKTLGVLLMPCTSIFAVILSLALLRFDPRLAKNDTDTREHVRGVMLTVLIALCLFLGACSVAIVQASWKNLTWITRSITIGLPLLLLVLGNCLGKLRPNYAIGIRCPWTLESAAVWNRTHRLGGRLLVILSLIMLATVALGLGSSHFVWIILGALLGWSVITIGYAFALSRKETSRVGP